MHQYVVNPSNGDNNQCPTDVHSFLKNIIENVNLNQNVPIQDNSQFLLANKMPGPYIIQIPYNSFNNQAQYIMNLPNGQQVYVNQPIAFQQNEAGIQYNIPQVMPMATNFFQVDVNDLNKSNNSNNQNMPINTRSRKRSYSNQVKSESEVQVDQNSEQLYDTKNRPLLYSCSECSRKFSMQSRLTQHKKCHSNTRPFQCKACGFAFTQKSYLVRHAAVHKEERPYECSLCKKTYKHYGSLANHRKTHKNGSKNLEGQSDNENPIIVGTSVNLKVENQSLDVNNNPSTDTYEPNNNAEFIFQNQADPNQTYHSQFNPNNQAAHFSTSFPNILSTNNSIEPNSGFLSQLNSFYPIISNSVSLDNLKVEKNSSDNNNSSINGDFQQQTVNNRSSPNSTFTI